MECNKQPPHSSDITTPEDIRRKMAIDSLVDPTADSTNSALTIFLRCPSSPASSTSHSDMSDASVTPRASPSPSNQSMTPSTTGRVPRQTYDEEQNDFIWYWRVDMKKPWEGRPATGNFGDGVVERFNTYFNEHRPRQGLQCRYYRHLKQNGIKPIRKRQRIANESRYARFGLLESKKGIYYPWIRNAWMSQPQL
ncbi:MAG: hypothetical protein M1819_004249 [Sarea resinae]|nr:MAG: hypothetical protein M1819_004249 [Sarea resinae]